MRIAITGATGFIGKECCELLYTKKIPFFSCGKQNSATFYPCDILQRNDLQSFFKEIRPTHFLHLAWYTGENYAHSPQNIQWLEAGKQLIQLFLQYGGKRFVGVGTCYEYDLSEQPFVEECTCLVGQKAHTLYGQTKRQLGDYLHTFSFKHHLSWSWCRLFYVFGAQERASRLFPAACAHFARGENFLTQAYARSMDYIDVKDVAKCLVHILLSDYCGKINIGTGKAQSVHQMLSLLAQKFSTTLQVLPAVELDITPPIVADNSILKNVYNDIIFTPLQETLTAYHEKYSNIHGL